MEWAPSPRTSAILPWGEHQSRATGSQAGKRCTLLQFTVKRARTEYQSIQLVSFLHQDASHRGVFVPQRLTTTHTPFPAWITHAFLLRVSPKQYSFLKDLSNHYLSLLYLLKPPALVHLAAVTNVPHPGWLANNRHLLLTALEAGKLTIKLPTDPMSGEVSRPGS